MSVQYCLYYYRNNTIYYIVRFNLYVHVFTGTEKHELTSWNSFKSIFKFFNEHLQAQMEEDGDAGNVEEEKEEKVKKVEEEPKEERRDEPKEEQREEQKEKHGEELNEEQKEEVEDGSTVMTTHQKAKHEDL